MEWMTVIAQPLQKYKLFGDARTTFLLWDSIHKFKKTSNSNAKRTNSFAICTLFALSVFLISSFFLKMFAVFDEFVSKKNRISIISNFKLMKSAPAYFFFFIMISFTVDRPAKKGRRKNG